MKNSPRMLKTIGLVVCLSALVSAGQAQNREKFGISARAGGVNSVLGRVMVTRQGQAAQLLTDQDNLSAGDSVTTGQASQAEVLLNPGSYLRVAENSEFTLVDNSLDNLVVKLTKGSAIIEATGGEGADLQINVLANRQHFVIIRGGIYRINVQPGSTELLVRKGRVLTEVNSREVLKGGMRVTYAAAGPLTAKLDKKDQDQFDLWSKKRAETLARANERLSSRAVNGYLASMSPLEWAFSAANPWGLWAYSPFSRSFTFMPFHYGWSSPYGHYFGNCVWRGGFGGYGRDPSIVSYPGPSGGSSTGFPGGSSASGPSGTGSRPVTPSAPSAPMGSRSESRDSDSSNHANNRIRAPK
ncbi:MAG TPA: FecR family protein [Pyrinomonadaceae bacterium]|nr:FecR family protein [Pyrinomonadaceae bacterium]